METFLLYWQNAWAIIQDLGTWLLFGTLIAGLLHVFMPPNFVRNHLGRGNLSNVVKASLLGVPMPLCSCGVIPAAIGLKKDGASNGAATGFLVSTPQTGVDSITVSAVFLGLPFAAFKVVCAFITGIVAGIIVNFFESPPARIKEQSAKRELRQPCRNWRECSRELIEFAVDDLLYSVWKWIVLGILVSAAISTFIPTGALAEHAWTSGFSGMLLMLIIALPLYVCATASVPIAASLVVAGMPLGAALVFLMAGPATNVATVGAVSSEFGRRITIIYISVIAVLSIVFGWLFDIMIGDYFQPRELGGEHLGDLGVFGAVVLLALFVYFLIRDVQFWQKRRRQKKTMGEEWISLEVDGMTCVGCVRNINLAVSVQYGVDRVDVDLAQGRVIVHGHGFRPERIQEAIEEAGYQVQRIEQGRE